MRTRSAVSLARVSAAPALRKNEEQDEQHKTDGQRVERDAEDNRPEALGDRLAIVHSHYECREVRAEGNDNDRDRHVGQDALEP